MPDSSKEDHLKTMVMNLRMTLTVGRYYTYKSVVGSCVNLREAADQRIIEKINTTTDVNIILLK